MEVKCVKCQEKFIFAKRWFTKNDPKKFICRKCKIIATTTSDQFKESQRQLSLNKLSDSNIRRRMSLIAQINNIESSKKISKTLKEKYNDPEKKAEKSSQVKELWQNPEYRKKISNAIKLKWQDPNYRRTIKEKHQDRQIRSMFKHLTKEEKDIKKVLDSRKIKYEMNFRIHIHEFAFLINDEILVDTEGSKEKMLFIKNYFPNYKIVTSLSVLMKLLH